MVGHKLGEFAATTKFYRHGGRMQKELEAKQAMAGAAAVQAAVSPGAGVKRGPAPAKNI